MSSGTTATQARPEDTGLGTPRRRLRARRAAVAVAAIVGPLLVASSALLIYRGNPGWMYDAKVYREGAQAVLSGRDLYANVFRAGFTYTPFAALLFIPLASLSTPVIGVLWTTLSMGCLELSIWLCLGWIGIVSARLRIGLTAAACLAAIWLDPVSSTLLLGQVNLILMLMVLVDVWLPDGNRWKGIGVGVAASFKLLAGFFILYYLVTRRLRAAAVAAATFGATVAVGFVALPSDSIKYWGGKVLDISRVGDPQNPRSQSLQSLLVRWMHTNQGFQPAWVVLCLVIIVVALAVAVWAERKGDRLLALCTCAVATLLISPISWQHHWVWVVPVFLWVARKAWESRSLLLLIAAAVAFIEFYARPYQWIPVNKAADLHLGIWQLALSSTYGLSAVAFLAIAGGAMWRDRRTVLTRRANSS
ncbi:MAG: glycosyltransferase 87 family protein [Candidatus Dormiibacterota bacterium]